MKNFIGKKMLVKTWNKVIDYVIFCKKIWLHTMDFFVTKLVSPPNVKTIEETINKIINDKCSISRFGDGELKLISGKDISFQNHSQLLEDRLKEVLLSNTDNHMVCIPHVFGDNRQYTPLYAAEWKNHLIEYRLKWYKNLNMKKVYFNSLISRCYLCFGDTNRSRHFFENIKKIWDGRNIIIIEGEFSRLGVGNDLFDNVKSIQRILCPSKNAFLHYNDIISTVKNTSKNNLVLIALGPAATILSFDLNKEGFQAIDIGHIDIEYEWYLKGATRKVSIKNKFVNEVNGGKFERDIISNKYLDEIIHNLNDIPKTAREG
jgi:glycosyltransferase family protein